MPVHRGLEGPAELAARLHGINPASLPSKAQDEHRVTNADGIVVPDLSHAMNVSGYPVSSDVFLFEKQQTFNRSKTLERMVHPAGSGALGYFETTTDFASKFTKASFLSNIGKQTPVLARFSTVTFGKEFPDSARNPRGFALKFYTEDGNYDVVGLNWPVFFVRDPMMGPDVIRSQQRNPANFLFDWQAVVDFMANVPESLHAGTMFFSDHGTPVGWRFMEGYGCHTFKWVDKNGAYVYVKYHFVSQNGVKQFTNDEAVKMCGEDPDFAKRDLWEHLEKGGTAVWKLYVQVMTQAQADACPYDPFDVTKVWYRKDFPMQEVGRLILNRNPENYHRDIEQVAFSPGSMVPGVEPSYDELLNWRMFFYRDAQYHRLGTNLHQIPVNCPFMANNFNPLSRDGAMRCDTNGGNAPAFFPNSAPNAPCPSSAADFQPVPVKGVIARNRNKHEGKTMNEYEQVRELYTRVMNDQQRQNLHKNISIAMRHCNPTVKERFLVQLEKIHPSYAEGVRQACAAHSQCIRPEVLSTLK